MKKPVFTNDEIYHIYNRGVEKRTIFMDDGDRLRFLHDLFEFNDQDPFPTAAYHFKKQNSEVRPLNFGKRKNKQRKPRKLLVEILAFCLMPNHYHLLLKQSINDGIVNFMKKLGTGYAMHFNQKYERVGPLFQGRFKAVLINQNSQFVYIPYYIHLNPLKIIYPLWRERKINNYDEAINFLENYRWSSFLDYIGKKNFPSITQRDFLQEFLGAPQQYKKDTYRWLKDQNSEVRPLNFD